MTKTETRNYYTTRNYTHSYANHSTFGGYVNLGDFCTEYPQKKGEWTQRIVQDWQFDMCCKRNAENRDRQKNNKKEVI